MADFWLEDEEGGVTLAEKIAEASSFSQQQQQQQQSQGSSSSQQQPFMYECDVCGSKETEVDEVTGRLVCTECFTQSQQIMTQDSTMDYDDVIQLAAKSKAGHVVRMHTRKDGSGRRGGVSKKDITLLNTTETIPELKVCLNAFQCVLKQCTLRVAKLLAFDDRERQNLLEIVRILWFGYLRSWMTGANYYGAKYPTVRLAFRDFFTDHGELQAQIQRAIAWKIMQEEKQEKMEQEPKQEENEEEMLFEEETMDNKKSGKKSNKRKGFQELKDAQKRKRQNNKKESDEDMDYEEYPQQRSKQLSIKEERNDSGVKDTQLPALPAEPASPSAKNANPWQAVDDSSKPDWRTLASRPSGISPHLAVMPPLPPSWTNPDPVDIKTKPAYLRRKQNFVIFQMIASETYRQTKGSREAALLLKCSMKLIVTILYTATQRAGVTTRHFQDWLRQGDLPLLGQAAYNTCLTKELRDKMHLLRPFFQMRTIPRAAEMNGASTLLLVAAGVKSLEVWRGVVNPDDHDAKQSPCVPAAKVIQNTLPLPCVPTTLAQCAVDLGLGTEVLSTALSFIGLEKRGLNEIIWPVDEIRRLTDALAILVCATVAVHDEGDWSFVRPNTKQTRIPWTDDEFEAMRGCDVKAYLDFYEAYRHFDPNQLNMTGSGPNQKIESMGPKFTKLFDEDDKFHENWERRNKKKDRPKVRSSSVVALGVSNPEEYAYPLRQLVYAALGGDKAVEWPDLLLHERMLIQFVANACYFESDEIEEALQKMLLQTVKQRDKKYKELNKRERKKRKRKQSTRGQFDVPASKELPSLKEPPIEALPGRKKPPSAKRMSPEEESSPFAV